MENEFLLFEASALKQHFSYELQKRDLSGIEDFLFGIIDSCHAISIIPEKHGRWLDSRDLASTNTNQQERYKKVVCSVCLKSNYNNHSNFCPNCGAKMDGTVEVKNGEK